jgi:L-iditol 2-dehydrogenase
MKQIVCHATGKTEIADIAEPLLRDGDILLKLEACGICGTDLMKVYDEKTAKPVQLGHEIVGIIAGVGHGVTSYKPGMRVAVAHHAPDSQSHYSRRGSETQDPHFKATNVDPGGFAELIRVPAELVPHTVHLVPDHVPAMRATFMEPLACCLRAIERAPVEMGDTVLVVGVGAIGMLFLPLIISAGATVVAVDVKPDRLRMARGWGAHETLTADKDDVAVVAKRSSGGRGADIVILTATNPATLGLALDSVRDGGTIIPFGVKPGSTLPFDFWQIYRREISIMTSYSATPAGLAQAMKLLSGAGFEFEKTISEVVPLAQGPHAFERLHSGKATKIIVSAG